MPIRKVYADRLMKNLCPDCGNSKEEYTKARCKACLNKRKDAERARREAKRQKEKATRVSKKERDFVAENELLKKQLWTLSKKRTFSGTQLYDDSSNLIGIVSDTHIGSLYSNLEALESIYDLFVHRGIQAVYHCGDLCDGENMYRGQVYEIYTHGAMAQVREVVDKYPRRPGITTHFIAGNHDMSFWKRSGIEIGKMISYEREDMIYLGPDEATITLPYQYSPGRSCRVRLAHPGKGTAYALSYQPQKYVEALSGGEKPEVVAIGHYHKAEMIPSYRNVMVLQAGTLQSQTPFMRARSLAANIGAWVIEVNINKSDLTSRFTAEFIAVYEPQG